MTTCREKESISIVISAYQCQDFIEECLDSIASQINWSFSRLEVVLGIDGCRETLKKAKEIQDKYDKINLRLYNFKTNTGCYITTNTLISLAKYNNILTFGADDIMNTNMVSKIMAVDNKFNMIKFRMLNFQDSNRDNCYVYKIAAEGSRFFDKRLFMLVGGYVPWRHTGDSEFLIRTRVLLSEYCIDEVLFKRRLHPKALTIAPRTCLGSEERLEKKREMYNNYDNNIIKIEMVVNNKYKLIPPPKVRRIMKEQSVVDRINKLIDSVGIGRIQQYGWDENYDKYYCSYYTGYNDKTILRDNYYFTNDNSRLDYNAKIGLTTTDSYFKTIFIHNHANIITYSEIQLTIKENSITKHYKIISNEKVDNKQLTLWKRI